MRTKKGSLVKREIIVPLAMKPIVERAGYAPAVRVENLVFCAGQVGRDANMNVINDPEKQFEACWDNLATVLSAAGCSFEDVVEMTTYHVGLQQHMHTFRKVKDRIFPRGTCAWTCIGVSELAHPGLLVEIKVVAAIPSHPLELSGS
ncbi:RidA family protein (plasmid) [Aliirhizobium terrae]|uniref:RidA family protein n=1 Tax=Terrirhizobium terrae TaxID=2926709 RepID=UPI002578A6CE|nr:RidA family protein [Rhizobium sp. CC-CFT758]WJH38252.1 RidA family protein [Rhizobium sp. CC-CFT758]